MTIVLKGEEIDEGKAFLRDAFSVVKTIFSNAKSMIKQGELIKDIELMAENEIRMNGYGLAFPPQVSQGSIAAHSCQSMSSEEVINKEYVKLDIGLLSENGLIFDTARTFLGGEMINVVNEALMNALSVLKPGVMVSEIGKAIEETALRYGFNPIRNLGGHGLNRFVIHDSPHIPNYDNGSNISLEYGSMIAIEPFITNGEGFVRDKGTPTIYSLKSNARARSNSAKALIKSYGNGIPFSLKDVERMNAKLGLLELRRNNYLIEYPPLVEVSSGLVAQAETTVIILDKPYYFFNTP